MLSITEYEFKLIFPTYPPSLSHIFYFPPFFLFFLFLLYPPLPFKFKLPPFPYFYSKLHQIPYFPFSHPYSIPFHSFFPIPISTHPSSLIPHPFLPLPFYPHIWYFDEYEIIFGCLERLSERDHILLFVNDICSFLSIYIWLCR